MFVTMEVNCIKKFDIWKLLFFIVIILTTLVYHKLIASLSMRAIFNATTDTDETIILAAHSVTTGQRDFQDANICDESFPRRNRTLAVSKSVVFVASDDAVYKAAENIHNKSYTPKPGDECKKKFPDCIIIGVFKAGTRELIDYMAMHPNIVIKHHPYYEFDFFQGNRYQSLSLNESYQWMLKQMPCSFSDQITVFKHAGYFENRLVPQRLYKFDRSLRMIVLVREPVERLIAHVLFVENLTTSLALEKYLWREIINVDTGKVRKNNSLARLSIYDESLKRYLQFFNMNQIMIIEDKEFKRDPVRVLKRVEQFLSLPPFITEVSFVYNKNKGFYCVNLCMNAYCYGNRRGRRIETSISSKTRKTLHDFYRPHNKMFFSMVNKTFDW